MSDEEAVAAWVRTEEENKRNDVLQRLEEELHPRRSCLHRCFIFLCFLTCCAAILMGIGQFLGVLYDKQDPIQWVLRLYVTMLCILIILNELEWTKYTRESVILRFWITRGFFYAFVGVLGIDQNFSATIRNNNVANAAATLYFTAVAWFMIVCGILYTALGLCCLQIAHDKMKTSYQTRLERAKVGERATSLYRDAVEGGGGGGGGGGGDGRSQDRVI